jgi:SAM-dependent methyltransferase
VERLERTLREAAVRYPADFRQGQLADVERIAFHVNLVRKHVPPGGHLADIGGGLSMFALVCALEGIATTLVDDFRDPYPGHSPDSVVLDQHRRAGVSIVARDITLGTALERGSFDAVTCFEVLEHLHGGVKILVEEMVDALRPGGLLVISGPNAVNARKRFAVAFGRSNWSTFDSWYIGGQFRSHVREPVVKDFRRLAHSVPLTNVSVVGRNWLGYMRTHNRYQVAGMRAMDHLLRRRPQLCSTIYLVANKVW